jgi:hypothetical protein
MPQFRNSEHYYEKRYKAPINRLLLLSREEIPNITVRMLKSPVVHIVPEIF